MIDRQGICTRIKSAREQSGLTQQQLADLLNVTVRSVQLYEVDRIPWEHLTMISKVTGCDIGWLLFGEPVTQWYETVDVRLAAIEAKLDQLLDR